MPTIIMTVTPSMNEVNAATMLLTSLAGGRTIAKESDLKRHVRFVVLSFILSLVFLKFFLKLGYALFQIFVLVCVVCVYNNT